MTTLDPGSQTIGDGAPPLGDEPLIDLAGNLLPDKPPAPVAPAGRKAKKPPAKKPPAKVDTPPRTPGRPTNSARRRDSLEETIQGLALAVGIFNLADAEALSAGGPKLADALNNLADANPRIAKALDRTTSAAGWGGVIIALGGILVPIAANHGIIPTTAVEVDTTGTAMPSPASVHAMAASMVDGMSEDQAADVLRKLGVRVPGD